MTVKRPYNIQYWQQSWDILPQSDQIKNNTDHYCWSYQDLTFLRAYLNDTVYIHSREFCLNHKITDMQSWYYLGQLNIQDSDTAIDIGCGLHPWKQYFPNLIGMDSWEDMNPDIVDTFDQEFCCKRKNLFDKIVAVNSIHFASIAEMNNRIEWIYDMLKPGGRAWISTNIETWLMYTDSRSVSIPDLAYAGKFALEILNLWSNRSIVVDHQLPRDIHSGIRNDLNGNLHLVLHKPV